MIEGFYDPLQDKIYANDELTYYHEEGHRAWFKNGYEQRLQGYAWLGVVGTLSGLGISSKSLIIGIVASIPLFLLLISEVHAWLFAFNKYWRNRK